MTDVVALVPMRHHSERVPGKNFRQLGDRPLFAHIIDTLLTCSGLDEIVIDTDSPEIRQLASRRYGSAVILLPRPDHLSDGTTSMNDVLLHDVGEIAAEIYLQTHSTNPFLRRETIEHAIDMFVDESRHDALFGVTRVQTRLYRADGEPINHDPEALIRTQDLEPIFEENSCLYLFRGETLTTKGKRTGSNPMMLEIPREEAWDIDEEIDFLVAECLWKASRTQT